MKILAVDFGDARTGIACSDASELLASPVGVIHEKNFQQVVEKVAGIITENKAEIVVIGYPKHMNNTVGDRAEKSVLFKKELSKQTEIPIILWDERGTTVSAIGYLNETNTRGKKRKNIVDAVAATIILENYLMWKRNNPGKIEPDYSREEN